MQLTFKDLKQQRFTIAAEPSETIAGVKEKIEQDKGWDRLTLKLIYSGKILQDEQTIESYKIDEKGFIVCMQSKPKAAPKPVEPSTPARVPSTPAAPPAPVSANASAATNAPATPTPAPAAAAAAPTSPGATFNDPSALALGEQRNAAIASMESMGFARDEIDRAMQAAFYNPDRAVEYLLNGIPASAQRQEQAAPAAQRPASNRGVQSPPPVGNTGGAAPPPAQTGDEPVNLFEAAAQRGTSGGGAGGRGGDNPLAAAGQGGGNTTNLDFLRSNPQFQQLRQVVQQQPQMLEPILQQVGAGNPQLAQIINQNPAQFMQLLAEDAGDDAALPPGAQQISVTEDEREAIERLCRLGFERDLVIQAYFACDKNEELAANFLFDQPDEDPEDPEA